LSEYITDEEFVKAQDLYNNELDEEKANEILRTIFWPYLNNLAFCTLRKELRKRGVIEFYSTDDLDNLAKTIVVKIINRYYAAKHCTGRHYKKYHTGYRKNYPKTLVYLATIGTLGQLQKYDREIPFSKFKSTDNLGSYDTFEDDLIEKLTQEGY
jgi:hypothetical protein